ncbi:MAG: hypothetical protein EB119_11075 [Synechococcaceae bacterium WBB_34_004]|nr:hypothetical protein [Synechococcaceae bacterium WBB_34_004]
MPPHLADQVEIFSGARTTQRQAELYQQAVAKYGAAGASKWVAPPGHSKHEHGIAADMRFGSKEARAAFVAAAATEGIHQPMSHEPWHFELAGAGGVRIHHNQGSYYSARGNHGGGSNGGVSISSGLGGKGHFEPYSQSPQIAETSDRKRFLEYLVSQGILSKAEASSEQFMDKFSHAVMDLTSKEGFKLGPGGIESVYADAAKLVREGYQPSTGYSTVDTGGYSGPLWAREAFNSSPGAA